MANPFQGDYLPSRAPIIFESGRPTVPFPHRGNYQQPLKILDSIFWNADQIDGPGRHNRYLDIPGIAPVFVTRDPSVIRAICTATGDKPGQFDRDTMPSVGIARATGKDTLLYANGPLWRRQRKLSASSFGKTTLFQPEKFQEFEITFRRTVAKRIKTLTTHLRQNNLTSHRLRLEPEIQALMLEMLTNNFFGTTIPDEEIRTRYVPALQGVIDHIVSDTVKNKLGIPITRLPSMTSSIRKAKHDYAVFEELTDRVLASRAQNTHHWRKFKSDATDELIRSNIKVFLAGALEATTSFTGWAISHLARNPDAQDKVFAEVKEIQSYEPEELRGASYLNLVMEETLRLTPSLYFLPRLATVDTWVDLPNSKRLMIPKGTHVLLDVWHANRHEDHWGASTAGSPAVEFVPERWQYLADQGVASKDMLHFGFGHGPRVCPGKHLGQLEVALVVGAFVKQFKFSAAEEQNEARAGVSTKPADGVLIDLELREPE